MSFTATTATATAATDERVVMNVERDDVCADDDAMDCDDAVVDKDIDGTDAATYLRVALPNVIPCNLREKSKFLSSFVHVSLPRENLRQFLRCYGFLMYDREQKLNVLRATCDPAVREIAAVLAECSTLADFKTSMNEHLVQVQRLLDDPNALGVLVDNGGDIDVAATAGTNVAEGENGSNVVDDAIARRLSAGRLLLMAKQALEYAFEFIRDSDHLRRSLNVDAYSREYLSGENTAVLAAVYDAWHDSPTCSLAECLAVIVRDAIVTTGLQTRTTMLFVIRSSLLFTYLVTNLMRSDTKIVVPPPTDATLRDYWFDEEITADRMVATIVVAMMRMYVGECVAWPKRALARMNLRRVHDSLVRELPNVQSRDKTLSWLRVMRTRRCGKRLYVRSETLLALFEQIAAARNGAPSGVNALGGAAVKLHVSNAALQRQWTEYENESALCTDEIAGALPSDSVARFVSTAPEYRRSADDLSSVKSTIGDDAHAFALDVASTLLFVALSAVRAGREDQRDESYGHRNGESTRNESFDRDARRAIDDDFDDARSEVHLVMLVDVMRHMHLSRMTVRQARELLGYLFRTRVSLVGLVDMSQLSDLMFTIYRLFPRVTRDASARSADECGDNSVRQQA